MITLQELIFRLTHFWKEKGCVIYQRYDLEIGGGTFNHTTFLSCLGLEPYQAAYVEPFGRPSYGRFGQNPNRLQLFLYQFQVILKPFPFDVHALYLQSLESIGFNLKEHNIRLCMFMDNIFDLKWNDTLSLGDISKQNEIEWSHYNFSKASIPMLPIHFEDYEQEAKQLIAESLPLPAYDFVIKASDARGVISVTERTGYISDIREFKSRDYDKELFTSDDDSDHDTRFKKSKLNSIESKTIDAMKNAATAKIFMNIFNLYCTQYRVDPSLKTIMDNGAASYELIQLLQLTLNESVKNNDKIEGETLNKLITRNFRTKTTVPYKTYYKATNIKVIEAYYNGNCNYAQDSIKNIEAIIIITLSKDSIKNIEAIMSYSNVINPFHLIHGPAETGDKFSIGNKQSNQAAPTQSRPSTYEASAPKIKA
ncbi:hypothetical protein ACTFIZ_012925 [Dictyostelium cf. discoideum]